MSKKKPGIEIKINTRSMILHVAHGCAVNQKATVMKDRTKYNRKRDKQHRRHYEE